MRRMDRELISINQDHRRESYIGNISSTKSGGKSGNVNHINTLAGLSVGAVSAGAPVRFQSSGSITEPSWNFSIGPVYLGLDGTLVQERNEGMKFIQQVGIATSPTTLVINIMPAIKLI